MHTLVVGMSGSGKTTLVKWLTQAMKRRGVKVAVLDPLLDPEWEADFITDKPDEFLSYARNNTKHVLVVDESGSAIGRFNEAMNWLATTSRHLGHTTFFIMQGATQVDPIIRGQCTKCFMFTSAGPIAEKVAIEFNEPSVGKSDRLGRGEFFLIDRYAELVRGRVDWDSRDVKMGGASEGPGSDPVSKTEEQKSDEKVSTDSVVLGSDSSDDNDATSLQR